MDLKKPTAEAQPFSLERPYSERQQIVVVPDEVIESERLAQVAANLEDDDAEDSILASLAKAFVLGGATLVSVELVVRGVAKLQERGIDVKMVGKTEASDLAFPPGHPYKQVVYVGHPAVPHFYYPMAEFHRRVFEHKFCEAVDLVMALGASKLSVARREGYGRDAAAEIDVPLTAKERLGGKLKHSASDDSGILFEAEFPGGVPTLPDNMVWYDSERTWQMLAQARIAHHTEHFGLSLQYENDYGITTDLKSTIEGAKLAIGGKFNKQENTIWQIDAEFPPSSTTQEAATTSRRD